MTENIDGPGWELVRPSPGWDHASWTEIGHLVPGPLSFWWSLQRYCVPECCGLDAYELEPAAVRWAAHLTDELPDGYSDWRSEEPVDAADLATELRHSAIQLRALGAEAASAPLFNEILAPEGYALIFEGVANALDTSDGN